MYLCFTHRRSQIAAKASSWPLGDPRDPQVKVGAMIEKAHFEKVLSYIEAGKKEGARLVLGGNATRQDSGGYFIELTIFDGVTNECGGCCCCCHCLILFFLQTLAA